MVPKIIVLHKSRGGSRRIPHGSSLTRFITGHAATLHKKILASCSKVLVYSLLGSLVLQISPAYAQAISQAEVFDLGINTYDVAIGCGAAAATSSSTTAQSDAQKIAQTFIIGFDVNTPKEVILGLVTKYHIGGIYPIGTKDASSKGFDKAFYDSLDKAAGIPLLKSSDEEGVIARYAYPPGSFPSAGDMSKLSDAKVQEIGTTAGKVMAGYGLTTDLAPVLDLRDVGIAKRSFSSDPAVVAQKAAAFASGLQSSGITPVFKHFPGFDSTTAGNTDNEKVVMSGSIDKTTEPYRAVLQKFPKAGVMLSNMYVTALDKDNPASISPASVDHLRSTLNFSGLITTDDLNVNSVINHVGSLDKAVSDSLQAGVTMPLFTLPNAGSPASAENELNTIIATVQKNSAAISAVSAAQPTIKLFKGGSVAQQASSAVNCCNIQGGSLVGGDNPAKIWNYFKGQGLDDIHVAAILGNIQQESTFNPRNAQVGPDTDDPSGFTTGGHAWGLTQWDPGSKVINIAQSFGITGPISDLGTQLSIIWLEMSKGPTPVHELNFLAEFNSKTTLADATDYFTVRYEGAGTVGPRLMYAEQALERFGNSGAGGVSAAGGSGSGCQQPSASPDCETVTGTAKILCAAKAYDTTSYKQALEGGHQGGAAWHQSCPVIGPSCYLDCSGLVNIAVYDITGVDLRENTGSERASQYWQRIPFEQLQPGDLVQPNSGHVEIIDHVEGNKLFTFGAHTDNGRAQPDQVGPTTWPVSPDNLYLRYIGPMPGV